MALFLAVLQGTMGEEEELQQQAELETIAKAMVDGKGNEASISDPNLTFTLTLTLTLTPTPTPTPTLTLTLTQA